MKAESEMSLNDKLQRWKLMWEKKRLEMEKKHRDEKLKTEIELMEIEDIRKTEKEMAWIVEII